MAQILFEHCQLKISEKVVVKDEKLREFICDTLQFKISKYMPLIIEKYHVTQQDMSNLMETLKAYIYPEHKTDFAFSLDSQQQELETTKIKLSSHAARNKEKTLNSCPRIVPCYEKCFSEDEAEKSLLNHKINVSKSKGEVTAGNCEWTSRKSEPEEMSCLSESKDMNNSEVGTEAGVNDVRREASTDKLPAQNVSDICQGQGSSNSNQTEFTFNWTEDWQFECAEWYMDTKFSRSFFNAAVRKDTQVTFRLWNSNPQVKLFIRLLQQLKFEKIIFNDGNKQQAQRLAEQVMCKTSAKVKVLAGHFMIVGLKEEVSEAEKMIMEKLQNEDKVKHRSSENLLVEDKSPLRKSKHTVSDEDVNASKTKQDSTHSSGSVFDHLQIKATDLFASHLFGNNDPISLKQKVFACNFSTEKSNLIVQVHKGDITKFKADCIVNATNKQLRHYGGVAKAIAEAAGWELVTDCENYIKAGKFVDVTNIFVSKGGRLPTKFVLHAVGPIWSTYEDKIQCLNDLRRTVLHCLIEAGQRGMSSIALPSISAGELPGMSRTTFILCCLPKCPTLPAATLSMPSGAFCLPEFQDFLCFSSPMLSEQDLPCDYATFRVPKENCARCYMEAVKHFDILNSKKASALREVHFIDVDDVMVNCITECFTKNWDKPCDQEMLNKDLEFASSRLHSTFKTQTMNKDYSKKAPGSLPSALPGAKETALAAGAVRKSDRSKSFLFGGVTLCIKSKHAFDFSAGITITIGKPFDKLSGLPDFQIEQNLKPTENMPYKENSYTFFNVTKPYRSDSHLWFFNVTKPYEIISRLLLSVYPEPDTADSITESFQNLEMAIQNCDTLGMKGKIMTGLIITSSSLYAEPQNDQGQKGHKNSFDKRRVRKFAACLHKYVDKLSRENQRSITSVTVVGSEDVLPIIEKVIESRVTLSSMGKHLLPFFRK